MLLAARHRRYTSLPNCIHTLDFLKINKSTCRSQSTARKFADRRCIHDLSACVLTHAVSAVLYDYEYPAGERERERMVQVGAWGSGSSCPTSGMVAADCPPRPIGRVREPAIVLSPRLAVTIHRRPTDLSRAFSNLSACHAPAIDRARLSAARSRRSRRRSHEATREGARATERVLINAKRDAHLV